MKGQVRFKGKILRVLCAFAFAFMLVPVGSFSAIAETIQQTPASSSSSKFCKMLLRIIRDAVRLLVWNRRELGMAHTAIDQAKEDI